jgi:hypothetical protein
MREVVRFSILEVGSCDSFLYMGSSSRDLTLLLNSMTIALSLSAGRI